jgi:enoyl-CoA hydratase/carnithine racemase
MQNVAGSSEVVLERRIDHIAIVTLNRPTVRNSVNGLMARALEAAVMTTEADESVRAVIVTGAGGQVFCAGADLKEIARGNVSSLWTDAGGFAGFVDAKRSKPWIAAVEGLALAGGCEIALACELIVAAEGGAFGLPEVSRGLIAAAGGLYRLPRSLPRCIAMNLILSGERISVERAADFGLVTLLVPPGRALAVAIERAAVIVRNAPLAVYESLAIARSAVDLNETELRSASVEAQRRLEATADFHEGALAFVEKRAPRWLGR